MLYKHYFIKNIRQKAIEGAQNYIKVTFLKTGRMEKEFLVYWGDENQTSHKNENDIFA